MARLYSSISQETTLSSPLGNNASLDTSMSVVSVAGLMAGTSIGTGNTFTVVIDPDTVNEEICYVTAGTTNPLTITRGQNGTSAKSHSVGAKVRHMAIGEDFTLAENHRNSSTGVHGASGAIVGTTDTQTLTNKTLTSPTINTPTITGGTITGLSSAGMVASSATPKDYVDAIFGSATAASTSATSASISASSAATSASSAATSASSAATSATSSATSASLASTSASSASVSQTAAAASAAAAAASASSAATSASSSATSQTAAAVSEAAAAGSAAAAALSAGAITTYSTLPTEFRQFGAAGSVLNNTPTRLDAAEQLLKQAVFWIDANHSSASGQTVSNLGWAGSVLNATCGSSGSSDSNDPKYLSWDGTNYVYLPGGVTANSLQVPDSSALDITGDIDLRFYGASDNWASGNQDLIAKSGYSGTGLISYQLRISSDSLILYWSHDGTTLRSATSTVATGIGAGVAKWIRATLDVDNGASGRDIKFYTSDDGVTWTQLGSTVTQAGVTSIHASTSDVGIGAQTLSGSGTFTGKVFRAQVLNGINGTPVLDVDTSLITSGSNTSFTALTGQTVTINRSTSGRKSVAVTTPCYLFGTDDYIEVNNRWIDGTTKSVYLPGVAGNYLSAPDSAALDVTGDIDVRVKVALDDWTPSAANQQLVTKYLTTGNQRSFTFLVASLTGKLLFNHSADGTNVITHESSVAPTVTDGSVLWVRATMDVDNGASGHDVKFWTSSDGTTWTQLGTTITTAGTTSIYSGTAPLEIGSYGSGATQFAQGRFYRAQVRNGIDGTIVFDANMETSITSLTQTTFTESSSNAATVTINKSGTGYVSTPIVQSGYIYPTGTSNLTPSTSSLLDFGASDSFTVLAVARLWNTAATFARLVAKTAGTTSAGYALTNYATPLTYPNYIGDGTNNITGVTATAFTAGALNAFGLRIDRSANQASNFLNGTINSTTAISSVGSLGNNRTLRIGMNLSDGNAVDTEVLAVAIFRRVLTAGEITTLSNYFAGRAA